MGAAGDDGVALAEVHVGMDRGRSKILLRFRERPVVEHCTV